MSKYQMLVGMKEHPTGDSLFHKGELLFPGDIFEVDADRIDRMPQDGGWKQAIKWDNTNHNHMPIEWAVVCAQPVPDETPLAKTQRDEPSKVIGINYNERLYQREEAARESEEAVAGPRLPVAKDAPESVKRTASGKRAA